MAAVVLTCGLLLSQTLGPGSSTLSFVTAPGPVLDTPRFQADFHRGRLRIAGHTRSAAHEQRLRRVLDAAFPGRETDIEFRPLGILPDHWVDSTVLLLEALSATWSISAVLTEDSLRVHGVATPEWSKQEDSLRMNLPADIELSVEMTAADAAIDVAALCVRALRKHRSEPVIFRRSGTAFRSSAYGELERLVALADTCRDSTVAITGHSDASGEEVWNQHLSLVRARTVADYLIRRGIAPERLLIEGAGSSMPVANNTTRLGRSQNRRVDIELRSDSPSDSSQ